MLQRFYRCVTGVLQGYMYVKGGVQGMLVPECTVTVLYRSALLYCSNREHFYSAETKCTSTMQ